MPRKLKPKPAELPAIPSELLAPKHERRFMGKHGYT